MVSHLQIDKKKTLKEVRSMNFWTNISPVYGSLQNNPDSEVCVTIYSYVKDANLTFLAVH
jgi:hypothetical protein